jgi:hypothetical protein
MTIYRMFYRHRGNPDIQGEALPVQSPKEAHDKCLEANRLFPDYQHWYKKNDNFTFEVE